MKKYNILITGAHGLLGKRVINRLCQTHNIYALVRQTPEIAIENVKYIIIDLSTDWDCRDLPYDLDVIIHLAQSSKFRQFPDQALDIFNVNIQSTAKLLNFAYTHNVKKFVYASSGGIYGTSSESFNENSPIIPKKDLGYYLGSKLCGEVLAQNYASLMSIITLRFFFMYGPEQEETMLIPRLVKSVKEDCPIRLQGKSGIKINPIHVVDAVNSLEKSLELEKSFAFNIAGKEILSLFDIAHVIGDVFNKNPVFDIENSDAKDLIADIGEMNKNLLMPKISFKEGIEGFV